MAKLNAKALEAALEAFELRPMSIEQRVKAIVTAYLDALPPAMHTTGFYLDDGSLVVSRGTFGKLSEGIARSDGALIEVEIREVRD